MSSWAWGKKIFYTPYQLCNIPPLLVEGRLNLKRYIKTKWQEVKILPFSAPAECRGKKEREEKTKEEEEIWRNEFKNAGGESRKLLLSPLCLICAQYDHSPAPLLQGRGKGQIHIIFSQERKRAREREKHRDKEKERLYRDCLDSAVHNEGNSEILK